MNKKGFTLVELLAVIVILALLALLTSTAVTKLVKDAKDDLSETQIQLIKSAADTWIADNLNKLPSSGSCGYLTLKDLKYYGLLDSTILDPKNSTEIPNDLKIKITTTTSAYGNPVTNAEVNPESVEGCSQIYFSICTISDDSTVQGLNAGAKYNCKVDPNKPEYTFFVLTTVTDPNAESVNLIMDSNINISGEPVKEGVTDIGLVAWYSNASDNSFGPITALNYLKTATLEWTNVNAQTINIFTSCDDKGNCTKESMSEHVVNARMPYYSEVSNIHITKLYLIDYLDNEYPFVEERNNVSGVMGYWTLSAYAPSTTNAWYVSHECYLKYNDNILTDSSFGVRPVITVPVNRITQTNQ